MSDPIFTKSFSQTDCKRFGCCAIFLCFIMLLGSPKPNLHPLSLIGDDLKMLMADDGTKANNRTIVICRSPNYCEMEGDIRVEAKSSAVVVVTPPDGISTAYTSTVEPYPRPNSRRVKKWRLSVTRDHNVPTCTQHHTHPAILFSTTGFTGAKTAAGNYFHDFADVLFPLYMSSSEFRREVQFVVTDYKPWWIRKYTRILNKLTRHEILDIDGETSQVHCYNKMQISLKFYNVFLPDPSLEPSPMRRFRVLLRETFSLERERVGRKASQAPNSVGRPRLMIIDRKHTRVITNMHQVSSMATRMGFEVIVAEPERSTDMAGFAEAVNSCDALMGMHGAGLTNMLFLPDNAVLIQVLPYGDVEWYARTDFGDPAPGMNLSYLNYKITAEESSLTKIYSTDHPIITNPQSFRGTGDFWGIYMKQQNVTIDLGRFKGTLAKALELLPPRLR